MTGAPQSRVPTAMVPSAMVPSAMVLAAGLGVRMRPLTLERPKPLLNLAGRTLLDHGLDRLAAAGVREAVVNAHYRAAMIATHLSARAAPPPTRLLLEPEPLETGGGVRNALPLLGDGPFFVINADIFWADGAVPALQRLAERWDDSSMDALLLLVPVPAAIGYAGAGDYSIGPDDRLLRRRERPAAPYVYAGVQLVHPRLYDHAPSGAFSNLLVWDQAEAAGRLFGLLHDGAWYHIGTPAGLAEAERRLAGAPSARP